MTRNEAAQFARSEFDKHNLSDWSIRLSTDANKPFLGLCDYQNKCIILNAHHIDLHPYEEVVNTIRHELAHALVGVGQGHNDIWADKARAVGCTSTMPCSHLSIPAHLLDAIRSGADVQFETVEEKIYKPKYTVTRIQELCPTCGKVAEEIKRVSLPTKSGDTVIMISLKCFHVITKTIPRGTPFDSLTSSDGKNPYKFQTEGMKFIEEALSIQMGAAIFDEMGLGKTIQALGYIKFHPEMQPVLYVTKAAITFQWFKEIIRWQGVENFAQLIRTAKDYIIPGLKSYVISYDLLRKFKPEDFAHIKTVVLDECQQIKNPDSTRTQTVRRIVKGKKVIGLSGTPWKNRGSEFFTILNMLSPMKFPSYARFQQEWVDYYYHGTRAKEGGIRNVARFKEYINDIALRREVFEVAVELPDVNRTLQYCELDNLSQNTYNDEVSEFVKWYNDVVISGEEDSAETQQNMLAKLARMRHITGLAKIPATVEFIETFLEETDRKITVFVHHKDVGELLYRECLEKFPDVKTYRLSADMNGMAREEAQNEFNKNPKCILIASTLASGEGLNLQTCSDSIMHERQWNPQNEDQAAPGRFRRIGSTADIINVTFMVAQETVDEHLSSLVERKRAQFHNTMNKSEMIQWNQGDLVKELAEAIVNAENKKSHKAKKFAMM